MMSTKDVVVKHRPSRVNDIIDQQIAYIPRLEEDQVECSMPYYIFEGRKIIVDPKRYMLFKLQYLHFNESMNSIKRRNYRSCRELLMSLIDKRVLRPFIVFINGLFIPWIAISIIINNDDYYLMIDSLRARHLAKLCESYEFVQVFSLPDSAYYINNPKEIKNLNTKPLFMFKNDGTFTDTSKDASYAIAYKTTSNNLNRLDQSFKQWHTNNAVNAFRLYDNNEKIKISKSNIFLFVQGKLHYGTLKQLKRAKIINSIIDGREVSYLEYYHSGNYSQNIPISISGNLLSINGGINTSRLEFDILLFTNGDYTSDNLDNIMRISEESRITAVKSSNNGTNLPYFQKLSTPFDLPINISNSFSHHMEQSESFIMEYNPYLYNELVKSYSAIDIQEFKGSEVLKVAKNSNTLSIGLNNSGEYEERLLLFVNGILHTNHDISVLNKNTIEIPIESTISEDDIVEFMRFKNVNNNEINIVINETDGFIYQRDHNINPDMRIFCNIPSNGEYEYPETGFQQFKVEYSLSQNTDGFVKIKLHDNFYYGKDLTIASRNRFMHKCFKVYTDNINTIDMGNYFKFCIDSNRYMIFVNGRLLNRDQYSIIIPCDITSENHQFFLDLNIFLKTTDRIDIVYSSTDLEDFILQSKIDHSGDIVVSNAESLEYIFSKELYMIWINGKKIPMSHLDDINSTCIRLNKDQTTINNLRVIKYIKCGIILNTISNNGFVWDDAIFNSEYTNDEINKIIGKKNVTLTNTEPNYSNNNSEPTVDISNNVLIFSDAKNTMSFDIVRNRAILEDPSQTIQSNVSGNTLYIEFEGSNN